MLNEKDVLHIAEIQVRHLERQLQEKGIHLMVDEAVLQEVIRQGYVRNLARAP